MLAAGGTKHYSELLKPFGLDAKDPKFWDGGLSVIAGHDRRAGGDGLSGRKTFVERWQRAVLYICITTRLGTWSLRIERIGMKIEIKKIGNSDGLLLTARIDAAA